MKMLEHKPAKVFCIVGTLIVFIVTVALNALASQPQYSSGIFTTDTGNVSHQHPTGITPANWTFSIWGAIYIWMALWIFYCQSTICKLTGTSYLYQEPPVLPSSFYLIYILNLLLNITWLILFDRALFVPSFCVSLAMFITAIIPLGISVYNLNKYLDLMYKDRLSVQVWSIRILVQNGIGMYATWLLVATHLNLDFALFYRWGVTKYVSDLVPLCMLIVFIVTWFTLDILMLDNFTRYLFMPYVVLVVAFTGIVYAKVNVNDLNRISIFILVLLCISSFFFVVKLICMIWRHFKSSQRLFTA